MALRLPLGTTDFRRLREDGLTYVDKTLLVRDLIDDTSKVLLLPRPRRFGKTLNLSMLRCFFEAVPEGAEREARQRLFADLAISQAGPEYQAHFARYPVIALSFKDLKANTWQECLQSTAALLSDLYAEHRDLLPGLPKEHAARFTAVLEQRAEPAALARAVFDLSAFLSRRHGERVLVLLDEYDTPLHGAHSQGYYEDALSFFRNLLSSLLKDNTALHKGVLTGILRMAKDSLITGLNNLEVFTLLRPEYASYFGFSEPEVMDLLRAAGREAALPEVRRWYNGYLFGEQVVYNPWSVLSYLKSRRGDFDTYWVGTSSNELVRDLLLKEGLGFSGELETLLRGEAIEKEVTEQVALRDLRDLPDLVWSFLLMTGYLKVVSQQLTRGRWVCRLAIPNLEVATIYQDLFLNWARQSLGGDAQRERLLRALFAGDAAQVEELLGVWLRNNASVFDTASHRPPERFYHGFVLGLLVSLSPRYEVRSNEESGYGRCDVLVLPLSEGQPGVALELKVRREDETVEHALLAAERQLRERDYAARLRERGAKPIQQLAIVFDGKHVHGRRLSET